MSTNERDYYKFLGRHGFGTSDKPLEEEVQHCKEFLRMFCRPATSLRNYYCGSYPLKGLAEKWLKSKAIKDWYVSNGAMIKAALDEGYKIKQYGQNAGFYHIPARRPRLNSLNQSRDELRSFP